MSVVNRSRPVASVRCEQLRQPGSKNGARPAASASILPGIHVDADHVVAELGHARGVHRTEVAAADDGDAELVSGTWGSRGHRESFRRA